ncbi:MAG TPA: hypothetical protein VFA89_06755 [Terriglobales bacterium]|nr:hypothetical protein [Terriglobales bacterium]
MQLAVTALAVTAGMIFSLSVAVLVEELIFGKVLPLFVRQMEHVKLEQER